jgi:hypothetical protein
MTALRQLGSEKSAQHRFRFMDMELDAITLQTAGALAEEGRTSAMTENFLPVELSAALSPNRLVRAHITGFGSNQSLLAYAAVSAEYPSAHSD